MSPEASLRLRDVAVTFEGTVSAQEGLKGWVAGKFGRQKKSPVYRVEALKNISLEIRHGERVGLIGLNGAGKSTLLKVMAGIYPPTHGSRQAVGQVCPLFEFATGFEMHQSGWDNIRIRGMLIGMSPDEVEAKIEAIAEFTELGDFLDYPVRTFSAGMFVRLAFAVSTSVNPEILLVDEVMGAGDIRFAEKARKRMLEFMEQGKIMVFSTHNFELLNNFCERTIWLRDGVIVADGATASVVDAYVQANKT